MADNARVSERRLAMRLMAYWQEIRGDREFASLADLNPESIREIWRDCFTVRLGTAGEQPSFQYLGESIAAQSGQTVRDLSPASVPEATPLGVALRDLDRLLELRYPMLDSGEFQAADGTRYLYRSILLPLADEHGVINSVLGGARCTAVRDDS